MGMMIGKVKTRKNRFSL
uniref:Uncharacterized protein n=1 Tax=Vitis vinifera TaxID=29760 RepID=F6HP75_VITVI